MKLITHRATRQNKNSVSRERDNEPLIINSKAPRTAREGKGKLNSRDSIAAAVTNPKNSIKAQVNCSSLRSLRSLKSLKSVNTRVSYINIDKKFQGESSEVKQVEEATTNRQTV